MTKAEEISILREAVAQLGADSYLGPVLSRELPFIEQELRSDHTPGGILCRIDELWKSLKATDEANNAAKAVHAKLMEHVQDARDTLSRAHERARSLAVTLRELSAAAGNLENWLGKAANAAFEESRKLEAKGRALR